MAGASPAMTNQEPKQELNLYSFSLWSENTPWSTI
jgi:hypothetical protein